MYTSGFQIATNVASNKILLHTSDLESSPNLLTLQTLTFTLIVLLIFLVMLKSFFFTIQYQNNFTNFQFRRESHDELKIIIIYRVIFRML